jgi:hypothetical protein
MGNDPSRPRLLHRVPGPVFPNGYCCGVSLYPVSETEAGVAEASRLVIAQTAADYALVSPPCTLGLVG